MSFTTAVADGLVAEDGTGVGIVIELSIPRTGTTSFPIEYAIRGFESR